MKIDLPSELVVAIDRYLDTDWSNCDPSKLGALNAVAYIGERVTAIVAARQADRAGRRGGPGRGPSQSGRR